MNSTSMPWLPSHGLNLSLNFLQGSRKNFLMQRQRSFDEIIMNRFISLQCDTFDDSEIGDPTFIYSTRFCPQSGFQDLLALVNEEGKVIIQNTAVGGRSSILTFFEAHNNAIFDVAWMPGSQSKLVTVSGDQSAKLWDFSNVGTSSEVEEINVFKGYTRSVKCVEFIPGDPNVFATGSRENAIFIWDIRRPTNNGAANIIRHAHTVQSSSGTPKHSRKRDSIVASGLKSSVTAIQFQDQHTLISSSDSDGILKVWDLRKSYDRYNREAKPKFHFPYPGKTTLKGYSSLVLDSVKSNLFASCKDHTVYKFELASYNEKPVASYTGFMNNSKYFNRLSLSPDGMYLASGSSDNFGRIWNVTPHGPALPIAKLEGHEAEVTCVEWCSYGLKLITCGDDMKHRTWRMIMDKKGVDKSLIAGEAILCPEIEYFTLPPYPSSTSVSSAPPSAVMKKTSSVKRRIFESSDNRTNVENQKLFAACPKKRVESSAAKTCPTLQSFPCSPQKMNASPQKQSCQLPKKLTISPRKFAIFNSPTSHLPNVVLDENASPLRSKPSSARKRQLDWLTTLSRQKKMSDSKRKSDLDQNQTISSPRSSKRQKLKL